MSTGTPRRVTVCTQASPQCHLKRDDAKDLARMHYHLHVNYPCQYVNRGRRQYW